MRKGISRAIKLLNKTPSARGREPSRELSREAPEVLKTIKVIATAIGCLPELDEKTPVAQGTACACFDCRAWRNEAWAELKTPTLMLAFIVPEAARQAADRDLLPVFLLG